MEYNGNFVKTKIKDLGLPYLRGILHTYAILNQPESTLIYEYDILEIKKTGLDLKSALLTEFDAFTGQPFTITTSGEKSLKETLLSWLFEEKLTYDRRIRYLVDGFYADLQHITDFTSIYLIDVKATNYDFGVYYESYVLESQASWYMLYFTYCD